MIFKNHCRPNSGAVIYTDKGCVTTVGGSATSLKQMKLIHLNQKEHGFCFFELGIFTFYCRVIKTLEQNCSFLSCCLFMATSPKSSILLSLSATNLPVGWLWCLPLNAMEVSPSKQCRLGYRGRSHLQRRDLCSSRLCLKSGWLCLHPPVHVQRLT